MTNITTDDALAVIRAHCAGQERSIRLEDAEGDQFDLGRCSDGWVIGAFTDIGRGCSTWNPVFSAPTLEECIAEARRRGLLG